MSRRYAFDATRTTSGAAKTVMTLGSATTIRPTVYYIVYGCAATPADNAHNIQINRITGLGTGDAVTPLALDPADPASLTTCAEDHSAEPTKTAGAILLSFSVNQQATFRWQTIPEEGLVSPATAANGLALVQILISGGTPKVEATFHFAE